MATLVGLVQGILAGISILAVSAGLLYMTSVSGGAVRLVVNGTVVEISADQSVASAADRLETEDAMPADDGVEIEEDTATGTPAVVTDDPPAPGGLPPLAPDVLAGYYRVVAPDLSALVVSLGRLSSLLASPRPEEEGWRSDVSQLIDLVRGGHEHLLLLQLPADATTIHAYLLDTSAVCIGVADSLSGDISQIPADLFPLIGQAFQRCTDETRTVAEALY